MLHAGPMLVDYRIGPHTGPPGKHPARACRSRCICTSLYIALLDLGKNGRVGPAHANFRPQHNAIEGWVAQATCSLIRDAWRLMKGGDDGRSVEGMSCTPSSHPSPQPIFDRRVTGEFRPGFDNIYKLRAKLDQFGADSAEMPLMQKKTLKHRSKITPKTDFKHCLRITRLRSRFAELGRVRCDSGRGKLSSAEFGPTSAEFGRGANSEELV